MSDFISPASSDVNLSCCVVGSPKHAQVCMKACRLWTFVTALEILYYRTHWRLASFCHEPSAGGRCSRLVITPHLHHIVLVHYFETEHWNGYLYIYHIYRYKCVCMNTYSCEWEGSDRNVSHIDIEKLPSLHHYQPTNASVHHLALLWQSVWTHRCQNHAQVCEVSSKHQLSSPR